MNRMAIAIQVNDRNVFFGAQWPTWHTLKALAKFELGRLKRKINKVSLQVAIAIMPIPAMAVG